MPVRRLRWDGWRRRRLRRGSGVCLLVLCTVLPVAAHAQVPSGPAGADPTSGANTGAVLDGLNKDASVEQWADAVLLLTDASVRHRVRSRLLADEPWVRSALVRLLRHPRLAVRVGALDMLEEHSGSDLAFDPWGDMDAPGNTEGLRRWDAWADGDSGADATRYEPLSEAQVGAYVRELLRGDDRRASRARSMLLRGGMAVAGMLDRYRAANDALSPDDLDRVREVGYAIRLAPAGPQSTEMSRGLVFGGLDTRTDLIRRLPRTPGTTLPILRELLSSPHGLVREAAAESLARAGGLRAVPVLAAHLETEADRDVIFAILRSLGTVRSKRGLALLTSYLKHEDEDLVLAALESVVKLRSKLASDAIAACLEDPRWRVRAAACEAVTKLRLKELGDTLVGLLEDEDAFVRVCAVKALGAAGGAAILPQLEKVYHRDSSMVPVVFGALADMGLPVPASFRSVLEFEDAELLQAAVAALEECEGTEAVSIRCELASHEDEDVACTALRSAAGAMVNEARFRPALLAAVTGTGSARRLAALEGLQRLAYHRGGHTTDDRRLDELNSLLAEATGEGAGGSAGVTDDNPLQGLFDAFTEPTEEGGRGDAPDADTEAPPTDGLSSLFDAFAPDAGAAADDSDTPGDESDVPARAILDAAAEFVSADDNAVADAAALALMAGGDLRGCARLATRYSRLPENVRRDLLWKADALRFRSATREEAAETLQPLIFQGLADPSELVRSRAVSAAVKPGAMPWGIPAVFDALLRDGTVLMPEDVWRGMDDAGEIRHLTIKRELLDRADELLDLPDRPDLAVLGCLLIQHLSPGREGETLLAQAGSENDWVRRAAYAALIRHWPKERDHAIAQVRTDPSPAVREVLPLAAMRVESGYRHDFFGEGRRVERWRSSSSAAFGATGEMKEALRDLAEDSVQTVRFYAKIALLSLGEPVAAADLHGELEGLGDLKTALSTVYRVMSRNSMEKVWDEEYRVLADVLHEHGFKGHINIATPEDADSDDADLTGLADADYLPREAPSRAAVQAALAPDADEPRTVVLAYFDKRGCSDCDRVKAWLSDVQAARPDVQVRIFDIARSRSLELNEALCSRFGVPVSQRLVAPAVFGAGGALVRMEITRAALDDLVRRSRVSASTGWLDVSTEESAASGRQIAERFQSFRVIVVLGLGLADGINPCAIAVIVFLLSYLQVMRRRGSEILRIGLAYVLAVYVTYLALGFGLLGAIQRLVVTSWGPHVVRWGVALFAGVLAVLSLRDAVLCFCGRVGDMTLQLPGVLKGLSRRVIRRGARSSHLMAAAFGMGVLVSLAELACTGQVYAPTIAYMVRGGGSRGRAALLLLLYNIAFVLPLVLIFVLSFFGLRSERLGELLVRRAGLSKLVLAALFAAMALTVLLA